MKRSFIIEEYILGSKANVYTIQFDGEEHNQMDQFLLTYSEDHKEEKDFIVDRIHFIAEKRGAQEKFFRYEGSKFDSIVALPEKGIGKKYLRLYCLRLCKTCIILVAGAIKDPEGEIHTTQGNPHLNSIISFMKEFSDEIDSRLNTKELTYNDYDELKGDLKFESDYSIDIKK